MIKIAKKIERSRNWCMILYPENDNHKRIIRELNKFDAVYILHDKDNYDNEEDELQKKEHWHVIIRYKNPRYHHGVVEELQVEPNLVKKCESLKGYLKYMIHYGYDDKYQYNIKDMIGSDSLKYTLKKSLNNDGIEEEERVIQIISYITGSENLVTLTDLSRFCYTNGFWSDFRRSSNIFLQLIKEHNDMISVKRRNDYD